MDYDAVVESGRNPVSKHLISRVSQSECGDEKANAARDWAPEPISRNRILRRERGQENVNFSCPAEYEQD